MKNFKYILISSIILFIIMSLTHFVYERVNNDIIAVFFPTNESIFQHMKMIYTSYFIFYLFLFILRKKLKLNNIFLSNLISSLVTIIFFLVIYIPIRFRFGDNMIFTFILLFIAIIIGQISSRKILKGEKQKYLDILSLLNISLIFIIFAYFTFNPIHNDIFWDKKHETYERVIKQ